MVVNDYSYIILKWGSLKAYEFSNEFISKNESLVKEFENIWDEIYNTRCSATAGSEYLHSKKELKLKLVNVLEKFYDLGVTFENGFTDEYYNNFQDIKDYILNYGE